MESAKIRRHPELGVTDRHTVNQILDEGFVCHAAYLIDDRPVVSVVRQGLRRAARGRGVRSRDGCLGRCGSREHRIRPTDPVADLEPGVMTPDYLTSFRGS